jgi:chain length determinant protein EpsF
MSIQQFLCILRARVWLISAVFVLVVAGALVATWLMPRTYTATAAVVLDVKSPDPIAGMILPGMIQPSYMATQLDLMRSQRVVSGALHAMPADQLDALRADWAEATGRARDSFEPWVANLLLRSFDAKPSKDSNVIFVSYRARDPDFAAQMANAWVDSYIKTVLELRVEPARQYRALFDEQLKQSRERLEVSQQKLSDYQRSHGLLGTDERLDVESGRLADLARQLVEIQEQRAESDSRRSQAAAGPDRSREALNSPVVVGLVTELSRQQARLRELQSSLGDEHPQVQQLRANIAELQGRVNGEVGKVGASLEQARRINVDREAQVRGALDQQRRKVFELKTQRDEALVLVRDVDSAQEAYNRLAMRRDQTSLESQSTQTNVSVVQRATRPYAPSGPKTTLNLLLAVAVGLVLAIGSALSIELWDRRLLADDDVARLVGVPLLGGMLRAPAGPAALAQHAYRALTTPTAPAAPSAS